MREKILELANELATINGVFRVAIYRGEPVTGIEAEYQSAQEQLQSAVDGALRTADRELCNRELINALRQLLGYADTMHPDDVGFAESAIARATYPATKTVHWPSGPVNCCDSHAEALIGLGRFMGAHVIATPAEGDAECSNCRNEALTETEESK